MKKVRLAGILNYEQANAYLDQHYLAEHNLLRACPDLALRLSSASTTTRQLDEVLWLEEERVISQDRLVHYRSQLLQLERPSRPRVPMKSRVLVREN